MWTYCVLGKVRFFNDINHTVDASRSEFLGTVTFAGTHLGSSDTITWILQYQGKALLAKYLSYFLCQTYHKIVLVDSCLVGLLTCAGTHLASEVAPTALIWEILLTKPTIFFWDDAILNLGANLKIPKFFNTERLLVSLSL